MRAGNCSYPVKGKDPKDRLGLAQATCHLGRGTMVMCTSVSLKNGELGTLVTEA